MLSLTLRSCPPGEACAISLYGFLPYGNRRMPSVVLLFWRSADIIASFTVFEGSASDPCFSVSIIWYFPLREFSRVLGSTSFPALCGVSACVWLSDVRILQSVRRKSPLSSSWIFAEGIDKGYHLWYNIITASGFRARSAQWCSLSQVRRVRNFQFLVTQRLQNKRAESGKSADNSEWSLC